MDWITTSDEGLQLAVPFKIGDSIYKIKPDCDIFGYVIPNEFVAVKKGQVSEIIINSGMEVFFSDEYGNTYCSDDFGREVFTSKEKAERAADIRSGRNKGEKENIYADEK